MQDPKNRYLRTIAQLCRAISSQLRHVSTIGKKLVKEQYLIHMSSQYGERWPTNGWDRFGSLGHPSTFQRVSHLGSVTASHSSNGHQPNFAALNRGRHLHSTGQPSRWALAHILVVQDSCRLSPIEFTLTDATKLDSVVASELAVWIIQCQGHSRKAEQDWIQIPEEFA